MLSIAGTFSKAPQAFGWDNDSYILNAVESSKVYVRNGTNSTNVTDWISGLGAILIGYHSPAFIEAVSSGVRRGAGFSLVTHLENLVADKLANMLKENVPYWNTHEEKSISVRFGSTGSDACSAAVRLARAVTGKDIIVSYGYHGWGSEFISSEPPGWGIPVDYKRDLVRKIKWNDTNSVEMAFSRGNIACIIIEQPPQEPEDGWYEYLRNVCYHYGSLLIVDEVVTGLRYGLGGASGKYNIKPDLICMGKGLGNGVPISAIIGRSDYMDWFSRVDPVFCSSTHWGNTVGLSAADYVISIWNEEKVDYINKIGMKIIQGLNNSGWKTFGTPVRSITSFESDLQRGFFINEMFSRGHLLNRPNFPHLGHEYSDVDGMLRAAKEVYSKWENADKNKLILEYKDRLPRVLFRNR